MGNRDARGREKRKPKKTEIKPTSTSAKRVAVYKPPTPSQQDQTNTVPVKTP
jgi:hypothetical protein